MDAMLQKLVLKLQLDNPSQSTLDFLSSEIEDATCEIKRYLNLSELPDVYKPKIIDMAAIFYKKDVIPNMSSFSYTEGQVAQTEHYTTMTQYQNTICELLASMARFRRVKCPSTSSLSH